VVSVPAECGVLGGFSLRVCAIAAACSVVLLAGGGTASVPGEIGERMS
jgi:hypothetical protein